METHAFPTWETFAGDNIKLYAGTTNASGLYSVTYPIPYDAVPHVNVQLQATDPTITCCLTDSTVSGFTAKVEQRQFVTVLAVSVLASTTEPVSGAAVKALVLE